MTLWPTPGTVTTRTPAASRVFCPEPAPRDISDENRWFTMLAFLRRRLAFLEELASFFYDGDRPLRAEELGDEFAWLPEAIASLDS